MKHPSRLLSAAALAALALGSLGASAAPLSQTTAVQARPEPSSSVISYLKAGTEPVLAAPDSGALSMEGWTAVSVPGPFLGYVQNNDLTKALTVKPGAKVYLEPKVGSAVLLSAGPGESLEITGLHGKWTQVRLNRSLVGYIRTGSPSPLADAAAPATPSPAPAPTTAPGKPAPASMDAAGAAGLPRFFEGRFASARRRFFWQDTRPYDWQIVGPSGSRIAYLDMHNVLLTDQLDKYVGRDVAVRGTARSVAGTDDLVVVVESFQLK